MLYMQLCPEKNTAFSGAGQFFGCLVEQGDTFVPRRARRLTLGFTFPESRLAARSSEEERGSAAQARSALYGFLQA